MPSGIGTWFPLHRCDPSAQAGLVYLEALAAGLPVLAFEANVVADHVRRDGTGWVASSESLRKDLISAMDETDGVMRHHVRAVFEANYSQDAVIPRIEKVYRELIGEEQGGHQKFGRPSEQIRP